MFTIDEQLGLIKKDLREMLSFSETGDPAPRLALLADARARLAAAKAQASPTQLLALEKFDSGLDELEQSIRHPDGNYYYHMGGLNYHLDEFLATNVEPAAPRFDASSSFVPPPPAPEAAPASSGMRWFLGLALLGAVVGGGIAALRRSKR